jgi:hypothetical protein
LAQPLTRPLKVFAFDPSLGRRHGNHMTVAVPYEPLRPGPRGRSIEVIDYDATNDCYYKPVDLDDHEILLQGGLSPSEADPRFHQQMVYAVASRTIQNFSFALGRPIEWTRRRRGRTRARPRPLRIFPHALQEANAYYDPDLHALLFGYFAATAADVGHNLPGQRIYSSLSHDIIAHETSHALVHDIRTFFMEPTSPDTLAFHEAFADIVALFQHFTFQEAVLEHIMRTGGALHRDELAPLAGYASRREAAGARPSTLAEEAQRNVLVSLAQQFGEAMGLRAALRSALGSPPDPAELEKRTEPHDRGAILVAAVFDAFFSVYAQRMADLFRIAGAGSGGGGQLDVDLAKRLSVEATKSARHFLNMCIRALDYCPPVDISFGDFLRALITADYDLVPDDDRGYRDIIIECFRRRGVRPTEAASYSESALRWQPPETRNGRGLVCRGLDFDVIWGTTPDVLRANARILSEFGARHAGAFGLKRPANGARGIQAWTFHPVHRVGPDGQLRFQFVVELLQQEEVSFGPRGNGGPRHTYRGGATLILNAEDGSVRYAVFKRLASRRRLERQRGFWDQWRATLLETYREPEMGRITADFARIHRGY